jgi:glycosyltransferase involved in cell wall biosynthesis
VSYCYNPFRYAWQERDVTVAARSWPLRAPLRMVLDRWREWDHSAAQRVDRYVACSHLTAARIRQSFGREAAVLHPPVELHRFWPGEVGEHYLVVAELMAHKRIDVAVEAFNELRAPLVVVGDGPESRRLRRLAGPTVKFTGRIGDEAVADLMRSARALVVTAAEEFGIAAVESLASGRPVIALGSGGVLETVRAGETGVYYEPGDPVALAKAVANFDPLGVDSAACVAAARRFALPRFEHTLRRLVDETVAAAEPAAGARRVAAG